MGGPGHGYLESRAGMRAYKQAKQMNQIHCERMKRNGEIKKKFHFQWNKFRDRFLFKCCLWHHFLFVGRIINTHRLLLISVGYFISINGVYIERHTASVELNARHSTYKFLQQKLILCKTKAKQKPNLCAHSERIWRGLLSRAKFFECKNIIVYNNKVSGSLATKFIFAHSFWIISFLYLIQFSLSVCVCALVSFLCHSFIHSLAPDSDLSAFRSFMCERLLAFWWINAFPFSMDTK